MYIDSHAHVNFDMYDDIKSVLSSALKNNVRKIINCAEDLNSSLKVIELHKQYNYLYPAVGIHPQNVDNSSTDDIANLEKIIRDEKVVAIGEIGLDYYYSRNNRERQILFFELQLKLAEKYNLPVIIHSRNATDDVFRILKNYTLKGVIHCFSGSIETAKEFIKLGYYLGIGGILTFKNSKLFEVIKEVPLEYILLETDSPFLTPEPFRKYKNEPKYIAVIANKLASIKDINEDDVMRITTDNANRVFDF